MSDTKPTKKQIINQLGELIAKDAVKFILHWYKEEPVDTNKKQYMAGADEIVLQIAENYNEDIDAAVFRAYNRLVALECKKK